MSQLDAVIERDVASSAGTVDMKLEVVVIPVSDVDRAKRFYGGLGWRLDADFVVGDAFRWSSSRLQARHARSTSAPGSRRPRRARHSGLYLVVSDIEAARAELVARGVDVSEVFHRAGPGKPPVSGPHPARQQLLQLTPRSTIRTATSGCCRRSPPGSRAGSNSNATSFASVVGSGERDAARVGRPRRARDAHGWPAR